MLIDDVLTSSYQETLQNAAEVHRFGQSIPDQMRAEQFARTGVTLTCTAILIVDYRVNCQRARMAY